MKALFFYIGPTLPLYARLCIASFAYQGFNAILYLGSVNLKACASQDPLLSSVDVRDSTEIMPIELLYKLKDPNRSTLPFAAYTDFFRALAINKHRDGWWFDTDVLCLSNVKDFENLSGLSQGKLIAGWQSANSLNNAVLHAYSPDISLHFCSSLFAHLDKVGYEHRWGDFGPSFLNLYAAANPDKLFMQPQEAFYSISDISFILDPNRVSAGRAMISKNSSYALHLWNEVLSMTSYPTDISPPQDSLLIELLLRAGIKAPPPFLPASTSTKILYSPSIGFKQALSSLFPALLEYLRRKGQTLLAGL